MLSVSKGKSPKSFAETWDGVQDNEDSFYLNLRNYLDFRVPFPRLHFSERLPLHSFPKAWNDQLDNELKSISNKNEFRLELKNLFIDRLPATVQCTNAFCRDCFSSSI